jgi:hypothetical protein
MVIAWYIQVLVESLAVSVLCNVLVITTSKVALANPSASSLMCLKYYVFFIQHFLPIFIINCKNIRFIFIYQSYNVQLRFLFCIWVYDYTTYTPYYDDTCLRYTFEFIFTFLLRVSFVERIFCTQYTSYLGCLYCIEIYARHFFSQSISLYCICLATKPMDLKLYSSLIIWYKMWEKYFRISPPIVCIFKFFLKKIYFIIFNITKVWLFFCILVAMF